MLTMANTDGFTQKELDLMNEAVEILMERDGMDEKNAQDRVNSRWIERVGLNDLTAPPPGRPLKAGEPRRKWAARLPESTVRLIRDLAEDRSSSQADIVADAVRRLAGD